MRRKVELAVGLDEIDVRLALGDDLLAAFAARGAQIAQMPNHVLLGIVDVHLACQVERLRAQHVIDAPVTGRKHPVVGVVALGEPGVMDARNQTP